jgi:bifunctional non-homologous end joining protein LigD
VSQVIEQTHLWCKEGRHDKVYEVCIGTNGGRYEVFARWGRRDTTLNVSLKGDFPSLESARSAALKLIESKRPKGYDVVDAKSFRFKGSTAPAPFDPIPQKPSPTPAAAPARARTTFRPQLLNAIGEDEIEALITNDEWIAEPKWDGIRFGIIIDAQRNVQGSVRTGHVRPVPQPVEDVVKEIFGGTTLDGELIGDTFYAFDVHHSCGEALANKTWEERRAILESLIEVFGNANVVLVECARGEAAKRALIARLQAEKAEGFVFKHRASKIEPDRPNSGGPWLKHKIVDTVTALVGEQRKGKRSVALMLLRETQVRPEDLDTSDSGLGLSYYQCGYGTVPANMDIPQPGSLVEVRYRHCNPNGSLIEPVILGVRTDKTEPDNYSTLRFRNEDDDS